MGISWLNGHFLSFFLHFVGIFAFLYNAISPQPMLTRWGTWLTAVFYYCEHFNTIKNIILKLDKNDSTSIEKVVDLIADPELELN